MQARQPTAVSKQPTRATNQYFKPLQANAPLTRYMPAGGHSRRAVGDCHDPKL